MASQPETRTRRLRSDDAEGDDGPFVDLSREEHADEAAGWRPRAANLSRHPTQRPARREPDDSDEPEGFEEAEADLVGDIAAATAAAVAAELKADQRKTAMQLAQHDRRLDDLEEGQEELARELAEAEAKAEAKAVGAAPAPSSNGASPAEPARASANGAVQAAAPTEIAITEPDLGKDRGKDEGRLPEDRNGPKPPRSGLRSIW